LDLLDPPRFHDPEDKIDLVELQRIMEGIEAEKGLISPLEVRPIPNNRFQIIIGWKRYLAQRKLWEKTQLPEYKEIKADVYETDDEQAILRSLTENLARTGELQLTIMDKITYLHETLGMSLDEISKALVKKPSWVKAYLKVQEVGTPFLKEKVEKHVITPQQAEPLTKLPEPKQAEVLEIVKSLEKEREKKMPVKEVREIVREHIKRDPEEELRDLMWMHNKMKEKRATPYSHLLGEVHWNRVPYLIIDEETEKVGEYFHRCIYKFRGREVYPLFKIKEGQEILKGIKVGGFWDPDTHDVTVAGEKFADARDNLIHEHAHFSLYKPVDWVAKLYDELCLEYEEVLPFWAEREVCLTDPKEKEAKKQEIIKQKVKEIEAWRDKYNNWFADESEKVANWLTEKLKKDGVWCA